MTTLHVDVFAEDYGWLFEDLKRHFVAARRPGLEVTASLAPHPAADRWIALRTGESHRSPDPGRTLVCVHDLFDDPGLYTAVGERRGVRHAAALWICHPAIRILLARDGVPLGGRHVLERPIGALEGFTCRQRLNERFTVGWIGRNDPVKRWPILVEALARAVLEQKAFEVRLVGEELDPLAAAVTALGIVVHHHDRRVVAIEDCPPLYRALDVLVVTSASEGQPMVVFEALACGVPVISTAVGWAPELARREPALVRLADGPEEIAAALRDVRASRAELFARRHAAAELVAEWRLEGWVDDLLTLAVELPEMRGLEVAS
ncbi:MAG: glycosyltransferase family 4 protein [Acidobacteria bacterium]|nr:glycosyltransferase family 4 protein [Acidobacteriota bacterium]